MYKQFIDDIKGNTDDPINLFKEAGLHLIILMLPVIIFLGLLACILWVLMKIRDKGDEEDDRRINNKK